MPRLRLAPLLDPSPLQWLDGLETKLTVLRGVVAWLAPRVGPLPCIPQPIGPARPKTPKWPCPHDHLVCLHCSFLSVSTTSTHVASYLNTIARVLKSASTGTHLLSLEAPGCLDRGVCLPLGAMQWQLLDLVVAIACVLVQFRPTACGSY